MVSSRKVNRGGAIALAICDPVLMIEIGSARSSLANQRSETFSPEVKNGDSAMPRATRTA